VTITLAVPAVPAGVVAVIDVALTTVTEVAAAPPKVTLVAPLKFVPVMVTACPPPVGPEEGDTAVTVGGPPTTLIRVIVSVESVELKFSAT
jgi:hypothetical protein